MKLLKEGDDALPKDQKGPIKVKCGYFCYFLAIFSKTASRDAIDQLSRDGFD